MEQKEIDGKIDKALKSFSVASWVVAVSGKYSVKEEEIIQSSIILISGGRELLLFDKLDLNIKVASMELVSNLLRMINVNVSGYNKISVDSSKKLIEVLSAPLKRHIITKSDNSVSLQFNGTTIVSLSFSVHADHLQVSTGGHTDSISKLKIDEQIEILNEILDVLEERTNGKAIIFSDADQSLTFRRVFKLVIDRFEIFAKAENPRTYNKIVFGILKPKNEIAEFKFGGPASTRSHNDFTGLCGGCKIVFGDQVTTKEHAVTVSSYIKDRLVANRKGLAIVTVGNNSDHELLEEFKIKKVPYTKNLFYYEGQQ